jgi:hypothetical protein
LSLTHKSGKKGRFAKVSQGVMVHTVTPFFVFVTELCPLLSIETYLVTKIERTGSGRKKPV